MVSAELHEGRQKQPTVRRRAGQQKILTPRSFRGIRMGYWGPMLNASVTFYGRTGGGRVRWPPTLQIRGRKLRVPARQWVPGLRH